MERQGVQYLNTLKPWAGRGGFELEGIRKVLSVLEDPQDKIPSIHVAGTNGKGSTSVFIASALGAAGLKVGINISPHLNQINERFIIDGLPVSDEWIDSNALLVKEAAHKTGVLLSFHEALTAIAFVGFKNENLDYIVIEVGLGGLLDASNVIKRPKACVITSIGFDHQEILGQTIEAITQQKAGIIKPSSEVFIGPLAKECTEIIKEKCVQTRSQLYITEQKYGSSIGLRGEHQRYNAAVAEKVLTSLGVSKETIEKGISNAFWPARLEYAQISIESQQREVLIDCAHNPQGMQALVQYLSQSSIAQVHLIFGTLDTKDWRQNLDLIKPYIKTFAYLAPDSPRSLPGNTICDYMEPSIKVTEIQWEKGNILSYIKQLEPNTLILLTGSIYTVGKLRSLLDIKDKPLWTKK